MPTRHYLILKLSICNTRSLASCLTITNLVGCELVSRSNNVGSTVNRLKVPLSRSLE